MGGMRNVELSIPKEAQVYGNEFRLDCHSKMIRAFGVWNSFVIWYSTVVIHLPPFRR